MLRFIEYLLGWQNTDHRMRIRLLQAYCEGVKLTAILFSSGTIAVLSIFMWHDVPHGPLLFWIALTAIGGFSYRAYAIFVRRKNLIEANPIRPALILLTLAFVYGLIWGYGIITLYPGAAPLSKAILLAIMIFASVASHSATIPGLIQMRMIPVTVMAMAAIFIDGTYQELAVLAIIVLWLFRSNNVVRHDYNLLHQQLMLQEQLRDQSLELEKVNAAKSNFLAIMSHEIRTPMHTILGIGELLAEEPLDTRQKKFVHSINVAGSYLAQQLGDFLNFSKLDIPNAELEEEIFNLAEIIAETIEMVELDASEKAITIFIEIEEGTARSWQGSAISIKQVLLNLLANAVKYTERGAIHVTAKSMAITQRQTNLVLAVDDTGPGIETTEIADIFEPYVRVGKTRSSNQGGTGLGLAICKQLVNHMKGVINVKSEFGIGATFTFSIPCLPITRADSDQITERAEAPIQEISSARILVVDDIELSLLVTTEFLKSLPVFIDTAANGEEAFAKYESRNYDAILTDIRMPQMNGITLIENIRSIEKTEHREPTSLIVITADESEISKRKAQQAGCTEYLVKPVSREKLLIILRDNLSSDDASVITNSEVDDNGQDQLAELLPQLYILLDADVIRMANFGAEENYSAINELVHTMRGYCSVFGLDEINDVITQTGDAAKGSNAPLVNSLVADLTQLVAHAKLNKS